MLGLSVVIPSFNSSEWLPSTLGALEYSLRNSPWVSEVIIVDDGSTDSTLEILSGISKTFSFPIKVISQENKGRFLARWAGISASGSEYILLLDSRVIIGDDSLRYVANEIKADKQDFVWNAHMETHKQSKLSGLFWDIPTRLFWGTYLRAPKRVRFGAAEFDKYPKGTTCLLVKASSLRNAYLAVWPKGDLSLVSDDTRLIRKLVEKDEIVLDPKFNAVYRPRVNFWSSFLHTTNRGVLFVDSYAGTSALRRLVILVLVSSPLTFLFFWAVGGGFWATLALVSLVISAGVIGFLRGASTRSLASFISLAIPLGFAFWLGLTRGVWVHRNHFVSGLGSRR
jgi:glycosyltransferase involved in cell wall biosynthesis